MRIELTARQRQITLFLLHRRHAVTAAELAARWGVGLRTVHKDLSAIRAMVQNRGAQLQTRPRVGIWLVADPALRAELQRELEGYDSATLSPAERQRLLLTELLWAGRPQSVERLAQALKSSRGTIQRDLKPLRGKLAGHGLILVSRRGRGLLVEGPERHRRRLLRDLLLAAAPPGQVASLLTGEGPQNESDLPPLWRERPGLMALQDAFKRVRQIEQRLQLIFTDTSHAALVLHTAVVLHRTSSGFQGNLEPLGSISTVTDTREYQAVAAVLQDTAAGESDVAELAAHFLEARVHRVLEPQGRNADDEALRQKVLALISQVGRRLDSDLSQDQQLREGLFIHLKSVIRAGGSQPNPLTADMTQYFPQVVAATAGALLETFPDLAGSPDEVAYVAMHFGAALERTGRFRSLRVLVVCSTGLGSGYLLAARVRREFPALQVAGITSSREVQPLLERNHVDLILSTLPLPQAPGLTVVVTPFLTPDDRERVRQAVARLPQAPALLELAPSLVDAILAVVERQSGIRDRSALRRDLLQLLRDPHGCMGIPGSTSLKSSLPPPVTDEGPGAETGDYPGQDLLLPLESELARVGVSLDPVVATGLATHLALAVDRLRSGRINQEPDLAAFQRQYPVLFAAAQRGLRSLARRAGRPVPPEEVVPILRYVLRQLKGDDNP